MLFNSYIFILLFLPICVLGYFLLNKTGKYELSNVFLIGMSLWFYGYYNPMYLIVICASILVNFTLSQVINRTTKASLRKLALICGILGNAASIFYFKYFDFFIDTVNKTMGWCFNLLHLILPLGISFFTFQQISYLVDTYKGQTKDYGFIEYALFVVFFPQLIAGPIVLHKETIPQFRNEGNRKFNIENFNKGIYIFSIGLFKKVMIADTFSIAVNWGFSNISSMTAMEAIIVSLCYTFQMYFDFSGYCDMAIGISNMFNILLPQNFDSPYKALSIPEYWNRWHMSLSRFLKEYIYIPLGGSRRGKIRTYINVMIVYLVSGIWHGANWTFIVWGLLHGVLNCLTRACSKWYEKLNVVIRWLLTFGAVDILFIMFRAPSLKDTFAFYKKIICLRDLSISSALGDCFKIPEINFIEHFKIVQSVVTTSNIWMWFFIVIAFVIIFALKNTSQIKFKNSVGQLMVSIVFLTWSILSLAGVSEFLYFGF